MADPNQLSIYNEEPPINPFDLVHCGPPRNVYVNVPESAVRAIRAQKVPLRMDMGELGEAVFLQEFVKVEGMPSDEGGANHTILRGGKLRTTAAPTALEINIPPHPQTPIEVVKYGLAKALRLCGRTPSFEPKYKSKVTLFKKEEKKEEIEN